MTRLERTYLDTVPVYGFLLLLLGGAIFFVLRPTVIVVTDDVFSAVYGGRREHFKRIEMSVRLFRRVKLARISEDAELDAVIFAVQDAARRPVSAVFPYRYYEAAQRYAARNPKTPVVVLAGRNKTPDNASPAAEGSGAEISGAKLGGALVFIKEDEAADFYRAGLCAAIFSANKATALSLNRQTDINKTILMMDNENVSQQTEDIFEQGLRKGGSGASCVFKTMNDNYPTADLSCIALWGQASNFLYSSTENDIPVIIFSWMDPEFSSPNIKIVIDDSPLQLLPEILKSLGRVNVKRDLSAGSNVEVFIPSTFKVISLRTKSLALAIRLNIALKLPVSGAE
jgi:hypothetical protein